MNAIRIISILLIFALLLPGFEPVFASADENKTTKGSEQAKDNSGQAVSQNNTAKTAPAVPDILLRRSAESHRFHIYPVSDDYSIGMLTQRKKDLTRVLKDIKRVRRIMIGGVDMDSLDCSMLQYNENSITIVHEGVEREIQLESINSLWTRGSYAGRGAKIGALVTSAITLLSLLPEFSKENDYRFLGVMIVFVSAIPGALIGTMIGGALQKWDLKYER